jgi:hypothetical protein
MKKLAILLCLFLLSLQARAFGSEKLEGAWLEDGVKWVKAPADINPRLQSAQVRILYFEKDGKFGRIECTVFRIAGKDMNISVGDARVVYKGEWKADGPLITLKYRLVEATIHRTGLELPGAVEEREIKVSAGQVLTFEGKTFHRAVALDKSAAEALNGVPASPQ